MLTATPQGFIVHWPESRPTNSSSDSSWMVAMDEILPYQDGDSLPSEDESATEILNSSKTALKWLSLPLMGLLRTPAKYSWYEAARRSALQHHLMSALMMRVCLLSHLTYSEVPTRQRPGRSQGRRRTSRKKDADFVLNSGGRLKHAISPA